MTRTKLYLSLWASPRLAQIITWRAEAETGGNRSKMLRRLVTYAVHRMPPEWPDTARDSDVEDFG